MYCSNPLSTKTLRHGKSKSHHVTSTTPHTNNRARIHVLWLGVVCGVWCVVCCNQTRTSVCEEVWRKRVCCVVLFCYLLFIDSTHPDHRNEHSKQVSINTKKEKKIRLLTGCIVSSFLIPIVIVIHHYLCVSSHSKCEYEYAAAAAAPAATWWLHKNNLNTGSNGMDIEENNGMDIEGSSGKKNQPIHIIVMQRRLANNIISRNNIDGEY